MVANPYHKSAAKTELFSNRLCDNRVDKLTTLTGFEPNLAISDSPIMVPESFPHVGVLLWNAEAAMSITVAPMNLL